MAKRRSRSKKSTRRRRRVGGASNDLLMTIVGGVAGAVGGKLLANVAAKALPSLSPTVQKWGVAAAQAVGGYYLAKKGKPGLMKGIGVGLAISGGMNVANNLGLPGMGRVPVMIPTRGGLVGGFSDVPRLGAITPNGGFPRPVTVGKVSNMSDVYTRMAGAGIY